MPVQRQVTPYATINGFNWLAALGGNWAPLDNTVLLGITWKQLGFFNILLVTLGLVYLAAHSVRGAASRRCCWRPITGWAFLRWLTACTSATWCPAYC